MRIMHKLVPRRQVLGQKWQSHLPWETLYQVSWNGSMWQKSKVGRENYGKKQKSVLGWDISKPIFVKGKILIFVGPDKHARTNGRFFDRTEWDQKTPILAEAKPELGLEFVKRA